MTFNYSKSMMIKTYYFIFLSRTYISYEIITHTHTHTHTQVKQNKSNMYLCSIYNPNNMQTKWTSNFATRGFFFIYNLFDSKDNIRWMEIILAYCYKLGVCLVILMFYKLVNILWYTWFAFIPKCICPYVV
jgi:hypothetical protein